MDSQHLLVSFLMLLFTFNSFQMIANGSQPSAKLYIVYLGERRHEDPNLVTASHHELLSSLLGSKEEALSSIVYSYRHAFSGFAAMLTDSQARHQSLKRLRKSTKEQNRCAISSQNKRIWIKTYIVQGMGGATGGAPGGGRPPCPLTASSSSTMTASSNSTMTTARTSEREEVLADEAWVDLEPLIQSSKNADDQYVAVSSNYWPEDWEELAYGDMNLWNFC